MITVDNWMLPMAYGNIMHAITTEGWALCGAVAAEWHLSSDQDNHLFRCNPCMNEMKRLMESNELDATSKAKYAEMVYHFFNS